MINVIICGINGKMGQNVLNSAKKTEEIKVVCGIDKVQGQVNGINVYSCFNDVKEKADVIIDFSSPALLEDILNYAKSNNVALVSATTGYSEQQLNEIKEVAKIIPVFRTANYSLGISVITELVKKATAVLNGFDIEIIEKHHNQKADAPSGTAIMLANAIQQVDGSYFLKFGRAGNNATRMPKEIGIHAVRGGNIVGEHEVMFAGENEIVTISHSAASRSVFSDGAIKATLFIANKKNGLFNMTDLVKELI